MPSLSAILTRGPRPDAAIMYRFTTGFATTEFDHWSPRVGDRLPGDDERIVWLFKIGGADRFLAPDGAAAGRASTADIGRLRHAEWERALEHADYSTAGATAVTTAVELTPDNAVVCIAPVTADGYAGRRYLAIVGQVFLADSRIVQRHKRCFRPATEADLAPPEDAA